MLTRGNTMRTLKMKRKDHKPKAEETDAVVAEKTKSSKNALKMNPKRLLSLCKRMAKKSKQKLKRHNLRNLRSLKSQ